jgi:hypothetical protein
MKSTPDNMFPGTLNAPRKLKNDKIKNKVAIPIVAPMSTSIFLSLPYNRCTEYL